MSNQNETAKFVPVNVHEAYETERAAKWLSRQMTTSEPTTGEIVATLRRGCLIVQRQAADRLESQERKIVGLTELNKAEYVLYKSEIDAYRIASESLKLTILRYMDMTQTLTDRAEQAEKERDTLISSIERLRTKKIELCSICEFEDLIACCHKNHCDGYQLFKRRGLPQDGEGERCRVEF